MKEEIKREIRLMQVLSMQTERKTNITQEEKIKEWDKAVEVISQRLYDNIQKKADTARELLK